VHRCRALMSRIPGTENGVGRFRRAWAEADGAALSKLMRDTVLNVGTLTYLNRRCYGVTDALEDDNILCCSYGRGGQTTLLPTSRQLPSVMEE